MDKVFDSVLRFTISHLTTGVAIIRIVITFYFVSIGDLTGRKASAWKIFGTTAWKDARTNRSVSYDRATKGDIHRM